MLRIPLDYEWQQSDNSAHCKISVQKNSIFAESVIILVEYFKIEREQDMMTFIICGAIVLTGLILTIKTKDPHFFNISHAGWSHIYGIMVL